MSEEDITAPMVKTHCSKELVAAAPELLEALCSIIDLSPMPNDTILNLPVGDSTEEFIMNYYNNAWTA